MLALACTSHRIAFNFDRLYEGVDEDYEMCLRVLVEHRYEASRSSG